METFLGIRGIEASPLYVKLKQTGAIDALRKMLLRQGAVRFGPPTEQTTKMIEGISSLEKLEELSERLLQVAGWDELLANGSPAN